MSSNMIAKTQIEQKRFKFFKDFKLQLIRNFHNTSRLLQKKCWLVRLRRTIYKVTALELIK